jgi:thiamine biosynthesis protein ThiI
MEIKSFLIKYAEIGTKGKNRYRFEDILCKRIRNRLRPLGTFEVKREYGRIFVEAQSEYDYDEAILRMSQIFGITGICPVWEVDHPTPESIDEAVAQYFKEEYDDYRFTFKVHVRRRDKSFPVHTMEMEARIGGVLLDHFEEDGLSVDVHEPEVMVEVEIRSKAYIYSKIIPGPGGLPVGTNGRAISLLSGGIDSPVATWMIAKRGVEMQAVYFHSPPFTSERALEKVQDLGRIVSHYAGPIKLHVVNFTKLQQSIYDNCPHDELTIIMKRYMFRVAEELAKREEAECIVTGESIGQVSSQTLFSLGVIDHAVECPVYRPCIGLDKQEIVDTSIRIGTYETSIRPYEDCCTIFVAKHPVTKPTLAQIEESEKKLEGIIEPIYEEALNSIEVCWLR